MKSKWDLWQYLDQYGMSSVEFRTKNHYFDSDLICNLNKIF
jgi:hypothetical protein